MLVPACLLVFIVLGGIAIDLSLQHSAQRTTFSTVSAAADDAAGMVDARAHQIDGSVRLDTEAAERVARAHLGIASENLRAGTEEVDPAQEIVASDVETTADSVTVSATVRVRHIFMRALPGAPDSSDVTVRAVGRFLE
jgi:hypothetical protein